MAPKAQCNAQKLAQVVAWVQKSRTVFSIKELEKELPKVAGVSSMQVKDYIQALQDDNKISCEKIGSGNWYFSFPSQAKREADTSLEKAQASHEQLGAVVKELRHKLAERAAQLEQEEAMLDSGEDSREEITHQKVVVDAEVSSLRKELAAYSDSDPAESQRKEAEIQSLRQDAERCTDDIYALEGWVSKRGMGEALTFYHMSFYGEEWSTDDDEFTALAHSSEN